MNHFTKILFIFCLVMLSSCERPVLKLEASPKLQEIQVSCEENNLPRMVYSPCEAVGVFSDGNSKRITEEVSWTSADPSIIQTPTLNGSSWVRGIASGSSDVVATMGSVSGTFGIQINSATPTSVTVAPANQIYIVGAKQQFKSICVFSDSSFFDVTRSSTWNSQNPGIASVSVASENYGVLSPLTFGNTNIEATFNGITGSTPVTVLDKMLLAIQIGSTSTNVIQGLTANFTVTGIYTDLSTIDLTTAATWSILDGAIASVSNLSGLKGQLNGLQVGTTKLIVNYGGYSDMIDVTVTNPSLGSISFSPVSPSVINGLSQQLTATGHFSDGSDLNLSEFATWTSSHPAVATVSNVVGQKGKIAALGVGTATVSATVSGITGTVSVAVTPAVLSSIQITPATPSIPLGTQQALTATGIYTDGSTVDLTSVANWISGNTSRATVGNTIGIKGVVSTVAMGTVTVSATVGSIVSQITVSVASPALTSIAVTPVSQSIAKGLTVQYIATGTYSNGSTADISSNVTWSSLNTSVATISNSAGSKGLATGSGVGTTFIRATLGSITGQTSIQVTAPTLLSIAVTPANSTIVVLFTVQYTATGIYSDGSTANLTSTVTWHSSNILTATVSNLFSHCGEVRGLGLGTTTITATLGGVVGTTQLNGIL